jgi:hypothetical protein
VAIPPWMHLISSKMESLRQSITWKLLFYIIWSNLRAELSLIFTRNEWLHLIFGTPGVWAWDLKLWFQCDHESSPEKPGLCGQAQSSCGGEASAEELLGDRATSPVDLVGRLLLSLKFGLTWELLALFAFLFSPFGMEMSIITLILQLHFRGT